MATNRLFIGNKSTREYITISSCGDNWSRLTMKQLKKINDLILTDNIWNDESDLIFFTESDEIHYHYFVANLHN